MKALFCLLAIGILSGCSEKKEDCKIPEDEIKASLEHMRDEIYQCDELARCMGEKRGQIIMSQQVSGFGDMIDRRSISYKCMVRASEYKWKKPIKGQINLPSEVIDGKYFDLDKISSALEACEAGKNSAGGRKKP